MVSKAVCHRLPVLVLLATVTASSASALTLRIGIIGPLNPPSPSLDASESHLVRDLIYEPLLAPNDDGVLTPRLARSWQQLPNGNVYVEPDTDRCFSDGSPVTREDIISSLVAAGLNPTPLGPGLEIGPGTGQVHPEAALPRAVIFKRSPAGYLGTGAFTIASQSHAEIVLERTSHIPHSIDRIELVPYSTQLDLFTALLRGDCNGGQNLNPVSADLNLSGLFHLQLVEAPPMHRRAIIFNRRLLSPEDRQALQAHLHSAGLENVGPATYTDGPFRVNPVRLGPGPKVNVIAWNGDRASYIIALAVRRMLGSRGGDVLVLSQQEAIAALQRDGAGIVVGPFQVWPDAEALALWRSGGPLAVTGYSNTTLDAALEAGDWAAARRAFNLDPPGVFLSESWVLFALDLRIIEPKLGRYLRYEHLPSWRVQ